MSMDGGPVSQRPQLAFENANASIEFLDRWRNIPGDYPISPLDLFMLQSGAGEIDRATLAGAPGLGWGVLRMNHSRAESEACAQNSHWIARRERSGDCPTRHQQP